MPRSCWRRSRTDSYRNLARKGPVLSQPRAVRRYCRGSNKKTGNTCGSRHGRVAGCCDAAWRARAVDVPWRSRLSRAMRGETDGASTWTPQCAGSSQKRLGSDAPPPRPCARGCGRGKGCRVGGGRCAPTCAQRGGRWPQEESCARSAHSAAAVCLGRCHRGQGRERLRTRQSASAWLRPVHRALGGGQEASSSRLRWLGAGPKRVSLEQGLRGNLPARKSFFFSAK